MNMLMLFACASFNTPMPQNASQVDRTSLAGKTMQCASKSGYNAFYASMASQILISASASTVDVDTSQLFALGGIGLGIYGLVESYNFYQYNERAGAILADSKSTLPACTK